MDVAKNRLVGVCLCICLRTFIFHVHCAALLAAVTKRGIMIDNLPSAQLLNMLTTGHDVKRWIEQYKCIVMVFVSTIIIV